MTRTEDRLTDALAAAASGVPEETLRPLNVQKPRPRRPAWLAPAAAVAGVTLVLGLAVAVSSRLPGSGGAVTNSISPPLRYYVEVSLTPGRPVVRSTATGAVTATVPVPLDRGAPGADIVSPAQNGTFFVAAFVPGLKGQRIYRFRLTQAGRITEFAKVPGAPLGGRRWQADAIAASPDGSQVAVAFQFIGTAGPCGGPSQRPCPRLGIHPDYITVLNAVTGASSLWQNGTGQRLSFSVASLSWTADGRQLAFLGQWCPRFSANNESCGEAGRVAQLRSVDPVSGGGRLDSGPILLRQSARFPYIAQALISPDGQTITVIVLRGSVVGSPAGTGLTPDNLSVEQISAATGKLLRVLYRRHLGSTFEINGVPDFLALTADGTGQQVMLNGGICVGHCTSGFNGWLHGGRLIPLQPADGREAGEAW